MATKPSPNPKPQPHTTTTNVVNSPCSIDEVAHSGNALDLLDSFQRAAFLRRLNDLRSPTAKLLPEILSVIFQLNAPPPVDFYAPRFYSEWGDFQGKGTHPHMVYAAVSSYWRQVVYSTPSLWTSVKLDFFSPEAIRRNAQALSVYLRTSSNHPIRLSLHFPCSGTDRFEAKNRDELVTPSVDPLIHANMARIRTLHLESPPAAWFSCLPKLSKLVDLSVQWNRSDSPTAEEIYFNTCRALRRLSVHAVDFPKIPKTPQKLPWSITVLDLHCIPIDTCIKLLLRTPNITECYLRDPCCPYADSHDTESWLGHPIVLECMHTLYLDRAILAYRWGTQFLQNVHIPRLRTLQISNDTNIAPRNPSEEAFYERIAPSLTTVEMIEASNFSRMSGATPGSIHLICPDSSATKLVLTKCDKYSLLNLFERLASRGRGGGSAKFMPKLKVISIRECFECEPGDDRELEPWYIEPVVPMLEQRLVGPNDTFRLEFTSLTVDWTPAVRNGLRALMKRGVRLEIVEDSGPVDWLDTPDQ